MNAADKKITISEETFSYLKCLRQLDTLYRYVCEALELNYGWTTADRIMNDEYSEKSCSIRDMIEKYMCVSIGENINTVEEITEI